ncbi:MAG: hypothetical protein ACK51F_05400 [Rhodospirillales bacterium]|jgi:hypothetical protein
MNAPRLSELMPLSALAGAAASRPPPADRPQIGPTRETSQGAAGVPDSARRRVDEEKQRQEQRSRPAQSMAEQKRAEEARERLEALQRAGVENNRERAEAARPEPRFTNRIGYFDGTTIMFVDLVDARTQRELLRIFGPTAPPKPDPKRPAEASRAYERTRRGGGEGGMVA